MLPTCSDFTVYANYDPATHTFHDPDGVEVANRGTIDGGGAYDQVTQGYSGFGTRFVTSDNVAAEIKDTRRQCNIHGGCTAFGFMHADCIGGEQVGSPAGHGPTPLPTPPNTCGIAMPGQGIVVGDSIASCNARFKATMQSDGNLVLRDEQQNARAIWATGTTSGYAAVFQADGNLVVYDAGRNPLWASHTQGKGGARLAFQDDGNVVLYDANDNALWSTGTEGQ